MEANLSINIRNLWFQKQNTGLRKLPLHVWKNGKICLKIVVLVISFINGSQMQAHENLHKDNLEGPVKEISMPSSHPEI